MALLGAGWKDVDGRDERGHDTKDNGSTTLSEPTRDSGQWC